MASKWRGGWALLLAAGCWIATAPVVAQTGGAQNLAPGFAGIALTDKVLLMPVDVELFSMSAGGINEPRADWTAAAQRNMREAIAARKQATRIDVVELAEADTDAFGELIALHAAVAQSIALHHSSGSTWALPTKGGQLLWSFGDAMAPLQAKSGARYALFMWVRDSYASAERKAAMVALVLLGVGIPLGAQVGYASLVDLQTGDVVWFNRLARPTGDLREPGPAKESIDSLLSGFPTAK